MTTPVSSRATANTNEGRTADQALSLIRAGQLDQASTLLSAAIQAGPTRSAVLRRLLAQVEWRRGLPAAALGWIEDAIRTTPTEAALWIERAQMLISLKRLPEALESLRQASQRVPGDVRILEMKAGLARQLNRSQEAVEAYRALLGLDPRRVDAATGIAEIETASGNAEAAIAAWRLVIQRQPGNENAALKLAELLIEQGELDQAIQAYSALVTAQPSSTQGWLALAQAEEDAGHPEGARQAYREVLKRRPDWGFALGSALAFERKAAPPEWVAIAETLLEHNATSDTDRALIGYGLGKVYESGGHYAQAFAAWTQANQARRRMIGALDRRALERRVAQTLETFTPDLSRRLLGCGSQDPRPVFIVGMPRSGTTLLEQIIASHPAARGCGERVDIPLIAAALPAQMGTLDEWPAAAGRLDARLIQESADRYLSTLDRNAGDTERLVDKAPTNFFHVGLIRTLFPLAPILWCRRDPRDVGLSIYSENFSLQQHYATDLRDIARYFQAQERLMAHWCQVFPQAVLEVRYEELVHNPEVLARRVIEFIGLPWNSACLNFHASNRAVQTPSRWQVRQPVHLRAVERWRHYKPWLGPLLDELGLQEE